MGIEDAINNLLPTWARIVAERANEILDDTNTTIKVDQLSDKIARGIKSDKLEISDLLNINKKILEQGEKLFTNPKSLAKEVERGLRKYKESKHLQSYGYMSENNFKKIKW